MPFEDTVNRNAHHPIVLANADVLQGTSSRGRLLVLAKIPPGVPVILNPIVELLNESYSLHSCRSSQKAYPAHASTIRSVGSTCFICASSGHSLRSQHLDLDRSPSAAEMQGMNTI
eukprot:1538057-Pyramimonas_sp.AAC.1